ncbi:MAG: DUF6538 domain-containing protein [Pseudomonadota bacterium]
MCRRNGHFYVRRRVPSAVRSEMGQGEIWRSLQTDSLKIALRRFPLISSLVEAAIEQARLNSGLSVDATLLRPLINDKARTTGLSSVTPLRETSQIVEQEPLPLAMTFGEAYQSYIDDPTHCWAERTRRTYDTTRKLAVSIIGENTPIRAVGRVQIRDLVGTRALMAIRRIGGFGLACTGSVRPGFDKPVRAPHHYQTTVLRRFSAVQNGFQES